MAELNVKDAAARVGHALTLLHDAHRMIGPPYWLVGELEVALETLEGIHRRLHPEIGEIEMEQYLAAR